MPTDEPELEHPTAPDHRKTTWRLLFLDRTEGNREAEGRRQGRGLRCRKLIARELIAPFRRLQPLIPMLQSSMPDQKTPTAPSAPARRLHSLCGRVASEVGARIGA